MVTRLHRRWRRILGALAFAYWAMPGRLGALIHEQAGAAGDVKLAYAASANLTVTNLNSLATSSTWVAGWESAAIDNTTNLYTDYRVTAKITVAAASLTAGEIRMYLVAMLDDSTWPDVFDGTESAETVTDTEMRDAICRLAAVTQTDTTNSDVYYLECPSVAAVFNGNLPAKFVVFITHSTGQNLAASGNQVTVKGSYANVAQS
jgi:hypothetical protein